MRGIKILDVSWLLPGPFATMLLADLGADVLKVEQPGRGDYARSLMPEVFQVLNRNKRSMTLNLKEGEGQTILHRLVRDADVLVEGFRPGVMARLNADYKTLSAINPRLIYCSISGYGQESPYKNWPGHDVSYLGVGGGIATPVDLKYPPLKGSLPVADLSSAMFAAMSIMAALWERSSTGRGQYIDVSITDAVVSWASVRLANVLWNGEPPVIRLSALSRIYEARDGKRISLAVTEDHFWPPFCHVIGREDWLRDERLRTHENRLKHAHELLPQVEEIIAQRPRAEWLRLFEEKDVPAAPVHDPMDVPEDPHIRARNLIWSRKDETGQERRVIGFPVQFSETKPRWYRMPPELGADTEETLLAAGFSRDQVTAWRQQGVI